MIDKESKIVVGGETYLCGRLTAPVALKLTLKLAPLLRGMSGLDPAAILKPATTPQAAIERGAALEHAIGSLLAGVGDLSEETVDWVLDKTLSVVQRALPGGTGWSQVWAPGHPTGHIMFEDLSLAEMLQLVGRVLMDNLMGFTRASPQTSQGQAVAPVNAR